MHLHIEYSNDTRQFHFYMFDEVITINEALIVEVSHANYSASTEAIGMGWHDFSP